MSIICLHGGAFMDDFVTADQAKDLSGTITIRISKANADMLKLNGKSYDIAITNLASDLDKLKQANEGNSIVVQVKLDRIITSMEKLDKLMK
jgi:hypothetical protein